MQPRESPHDCKTAGACGAGRFFQSSPASEPQNAGLSTAVLTRGALSRIPGAICPLVPSPHAVSLRLTHSDHLSTPKIAPAQEHGVDLGTTEREIVSGSGQSSHGHSCQRGACPRTHTHTRSTVKTPGAENYILTHSFLPNLTGY